MRALIKRYRAPRACLEIAVLLMTGMGPRLSVAAEGGVPFLVRFTGSVHGLAPGAPVEVRGIRVGEVVSVGVEYAADSNSFVAPVVIQLQPLCSRRLAPHLRGAEETYAAADVLLRRGLRAQLGTTELLGGKTVVTLDIRPDAPPANLGRAAPVPELPAGPTRADMVAERLQPLLDKLADAPIEQTCADAQAAMAALKDLATGPELRGALIELRAVAADLRSMVDRLGPKADGLIAPLGNTLQSTNRLIDRTGQTVATLDHQVGDRSPLLTVSGA